MMFAKGSYLEPSKLHDGMWALFLLGAWLLVRLSRNLCTLLCCTVGRRRGAEGGERLRVRAPLGQDGGLVRERAAGLSHNFWAVKLVLGNLAPFEHLH